MLNKSKAPANARKQAPAPKTDADPKSEKKPDPRNPPHDGPSQPAKPPQPQPSPSQPSKQQPAPQTKTNPAQQAGQGGGQGTFNVNDFFGNKDPKQAPQTGQPQGGKSPSAPAQQPNQTTQKPDFTNFFGTGSGGNTQPHSQPSNPNPLSGNTGPRPTMPVLPVAAEKAVDKAVEKKVEEKKAKTFNKLFGI